jgi:FKBP-type peptidyl-prolyl cis-trans isomerase
MKRIFCVLFLLLVSLGFCFALGAQGGDGGKKQDMSYSFGMIIALDLLDTGLEFDVNSFMRGFRNVMEGKETKFTPDEAMEIVDAAFQGVMAEQNEILRLEGEKNRAEGAAFLTMNAERPEVEVTPSGLQYELISEGDGERPGPADRVLVHYRGATIDGLVFDSSYDRGEPLEAPLDMVIPGWSEGLRMMREGGSARLYIPPHLAYGESGAGGAIGPNTVLVFDVELLTIIRSPQ